jgi:N-carbamoylputrescine amidase
VRVACAQYALRDGDAEHNRRRSVGEVLAAAEGGADLVVLPELSNSGCDLDAGEAPCLAETVPDGPTVRAWQEVARERGVFVAGGLLEKEGGALHNTAVLVGPGFFSSYRKTHLWDGEKTLYEPGRYLPVFDTPLGRVGLLVCYDAWFPEAARTLALRGADILCVPSNAPDDWVPEEMRPGGLTMLNVHCVANANANRLFVACANRVGDGYLGRSCIVDATGALLALGGAEEEARILADLDLSRAREEKRLTAGSHAFGDRNTSVYETRDFAAESGKQPEPRARSSGPPGR